MRLRLVEVDGELHMALPYDLVEEFSLEDGDSLEVDFPDEDIMTVFFPT